MGISLRGQLFNEIRTVVQDPKNPRSCVNIFEPTDEQLDELMDEIIHKDYLKVTDEEIIGDIKGSKFLYDMIDKFTDMTVDLDWNNKEDKKIIKKMFKSPSPLLKLVLIEMGNISNYAVKSLIKRMELLRNMDDEQRKILKIEDELEILNEKIEEELEEKEDE